MSYSLTTHEIPDFMTRFCDANCTTSLRGHRTPQVYRSNNDIACSKVQEKIFDIKFLGFYAFDEILNFRYTGACMHLLNPFCIGNLHTNTVYDK